MSKSWASTLRLPKSTFPPRPSPQNREQYIQRCADQFFEWQKASRPSADPFILHDGPPYANGDLHVGHALNKVLKDIILRVKVQQGRQVRYAPGWDCHGLPIEHKVIGAAEGKNMSPIAIRKAARKLASKTVLKQMKSFRSYGVMGDWEGRWTTMDAAYEIRQLRLFQQLVREGLIYRKYKPVYWSPSSGTALAEAELEYKDDHISTAAYIKFPIATPSNQKGQSTQRYLVIWTTTPWTLPANQAIGIHNDLEYCIIKVDGEELVIAESRLEELFAQCFPGLTPEIVDRVKGASLEGLNYRNKLRGKNAPLQPIVHADFVSASSGSGLVHLAPGHGMEDYEVCTRLKVPVIAPVDDNGCFTKEAYPDDPERLTSASPVTNGGGRDVLALLEKDVIVAHDYKHKYPYDWRTKQPLIVRATEQWFADVDSIKEQTLSALEDVQFVPASGRNRLESFVKGRSEWCISRQRAWGVPIPALYDKTGAAVVTEESVEHIISVMLERGTDAWWLDDANDPAWIPPNLDGEYRRGKDTMDVWFDSGSSWTMMKERADVYLEGSDQHRGWFQSSLLTRIAAGADRGADFVRGAPFKQLITHGFTLDQEGKKMSKSIGNTISPDEVMNGTLLPPIKKKGKAANGPPAYDALGPDALRLWAASSDYTRDVVLSVPVLQSVHTSLVKYRTIIKMLLGSMHESARNAPLTTTDHIALLQLSDTMAEVGKAFDQHEFYRGVAAINHWITNDLSAFYLEALKDRLYCGDGGGVLEPIFNGFLRMLGPVTPSLVEEAWDHRPEWLKDDGSAVHPLQQRYDEPLIDKARVTGDLHSLRGALPTLMATHAAIKSGLEAARAAKVVGSSLQCSVVLELPESGSNAAVTSLFTFADELRDMFVVSSAEITKRGGHISGAEWSYSQEFDLGGEKATAWILPPKQAKCPRCWRYVAPQEDELCQRCSDIV